MTGVLVVICFVLMYGFILRTLQVRDLREENTELHLYARRLELRQHGEWFL